MCYAQLFYVLCTVDFCVCHTTFFAFVTQLLKVTIKFVFAFNQCLKIQIIRNKHPLKDNIEQYSVLFLICQHIFVIFLKNISIQRRRTQLVKLRPIKLLLFYELKTTNINKQYKLSTIKFYINQYSVLFYTCQG